MTELEKFELENLKSIINRLEGNCFALKSLAITITAASIAFVSTLEANENIVLYSLIFMLLVFWHLDARYLFQGRLFRRQQQQFLENLSEDCLMKPQAEASLLATLFSWSVLWFYSALLTLIATILYSSWS